VPYAVAVRPDLEEHRDGSVRIGQVVFVMRASQKAIVLARRRIRRSHGGPPGDRRVWAAASTSCCSSGTAELAGGARGLRDQGIDWTAGDR
jgi:hypothetical protein